MYRCPPPTPSSSYLATNWYSKDLVPEQEGEGQLNLVVTISGTNKPDSPSNIRNWTGDKVGEGGGALPLCVIKTVPKVLQYQ
jgi:hypothetical protein